VNTPSLYWLSVTGMMASDENMSTKQTSILKAFIIQNIHLKSKNWLVFSVNGGWCI
jgi:hypothetical protein